MLEILQNGLKGLMRRLNKTFMGFAFIATMAGSILTPYSFAADAPKIYWSDGDSGRLNAMKFRLANIDAPETGSLKQRGGARCEAEREIGYEAKAFLVEFTRGKEVKIVQDYGEDRYNRLVVVMTANGVDVAKAAVEAGHLRPWPHNKGRAQAPKPDWCAHE